MQFVSGDVAYEGIAPCIGPGSFNTYPHANLVIAWFDGEPDLWMVESIDNLISYYEADWGKGCCGPKGRVVLKMFARM